MDYKVDYIVLTIRKFAERYALTNKQSYAYLKRYAGIAFLDECYDAEHTLSFDTAVDDLTQVCKLHGGKLE